MLKQELDTPSLIVDLEKLQHNIDDMAAFAARESVRLRPHAKTHKTPEIGRMQMDAGAAGLTLAKLGEAEVFVAAGLTDILIAYPIVGPTKLRRLFDLCERASITTVLDHREIAEGLSRAAVERDQELSVLVEVNTGLNRCGVVPGQPAVDLALAVARLPGLRFDGLLTHEGQAMIAGGPVQVRAAGLTAGEAMAETAASIRAAGLEVPVISVGLTATAKVTATVADVTEMRPGIYAFYDRGEVLHGVASWKDCAATVLATVVTRPVPDRVIVDAGSKSLSSDGILIQPPASSHGYVVGHPDWALEKLSEEHGWMKISPDDPVRIGDKVEIIPNHICPVFNLFSEMVLARADEVVGRWKVSARGKLQ
jgi:D-serine deaminase-like pyridoxal phosphate-dependent protein